MLKKLKRVNYMKSLISIKTTLKFWLKLKDKNVHSYHAAFCRIDMKSCLDLNCTLDGFEQLVVKPNKLAFWTVSNQKAHTT